MPIGVYDRTLIRTIPPEKRFWRYVNKTETCWWWTGSSRRYGFFNKGNKQTIVAHRFSYELHNGAIPVGLYVCHTCDNPLCVNPGHLFLGTQYDNMRDASRKQRFSRQKLGPEDWQKIQIDPRPLLEIAEEYKVSFQLISRIRLNKNGRYTCV